MKRIWVRIDPWDEALAAAAIESGADAVVVAAGDTARAKALGAAATVAPDGDIRLGEEAVPFEIGSKADEERAATTHLDRILMLRMVDWTIIPLENLIARRKGLMLEVTGADEARLATEILEKGVDGVVLTSRSADEIRRTVKLVHAFAPRIALEPAAVTAVRPLGMGDRSCLDTCTQMTLGQGMLVGNTSAGFFLVHSESAENPYLPARRFRVNAGAVHAYVLLPDDQTKYLSDLTAGDEVLVVAHDGASQPAFLGRNKIERRPLLLVQAEVGSRPVSLVVQNGETICLTAPDGQPVSVAGLKPGDAVLAHVRAESIGRHVGTAVEETIVEK